MRIYYIWNNKKSNAKTISAPSWNGKFELRDGSYSVSDIQNYFQYFINKHEKVSYNPPLRINVNEKENRITSRIKTGYYLQLLTPETTKLLEALKAKLKMKIVKMFLV